ncbi:MAG: hypothetical protein APF76_17880 [Desulfitibacter sp. BRH_c19]|nr:MAG: hypothetical protein APF76_17880 [Desulfitibacter sp. BRH_c19]
MSKTIRDALDIKLGNMITAVGAGGKTTFLKVLAKELIGQTAPVILTTTTKMFSPEKHEEILLISQKFSREYFKERLLEKPVQNGFIYLGKEINKEGKMIGLESYQVDLLKGLFPFILVEGDGSLRKSFKAPGEHEPIIPTETDLLCPVVGLKVIGKPLTGEFVHRPERVSSITGLRVGQIITQEAITKVLCSSEGYYKKEYKYVPVLNQADDLKNINDGLTIAEQIFAILPIKKIMITSFIKRPYMIKIVDR